MNGILPRLLLVVFTMAQAGRLFAAERLIGVQSARVMSQSMPWIAEETGIFRKYNLEFPLVYIGTSPLATAAMLGGEAQLMIDGGVGLARTAVGGNNDLVFIAGIKNILTQSILAKPEVKRLEDLRGKKIGVTTAVKKTWLSALGLAVLLGGFGFTLQRIAPQAISLGDLLR